MSRDGVDAKRELSRNVSSEVKSNQKHMTPGWVYPHVTGIGGARASSLGLTSARPALAEVTDLSWRMVLLLVVAACDSLSLSVALGPSLGR